MQEEIKITENTFNKQEFNSFVKDALSKIEKIEEAYKTLTEKLQPMVYELGFLKV